MKIKKSYFNTDTRVWIGLFLCAILIYGYHCYKEATKVYYQFQPGMTAEETIEAYFACWDNKDLAGMNSLRVADKKKMEIGKK